MEDDVVQSRCAAVVHQLLSSGPTSASDSDSRLIAAVSDALRQRAMLLYRLCRARHERLAEDQTNDAALCVLAAVASAQPALWSVLTRWSREARPRHPELRFAAATLRLREAEQFIARTAHLIPGQMQDDARKVKKKGKSEKEGVDMGPFDEGLAARLALAYFQRSTPDPKRLRALIAAHARDTGSLDAAPHTAALRQTKHRRDALRHMQRGDTSGGGHGAEQETRARTRTRTAAAAEEDEDDEDVDHGFLVSRTPAAASLLRFYSAGPMNWTALSNSIDDARREIFLAQLCRCMRDPLLYSPTAGMERLKARWSPTHESESVPEEEQEEKNKNNKKKEGKRNDVETACSLGVRYLHYCCDAMGSGSVCAPAHFLHPSRARPQSLVPVPVQWVTAQQLWARLLVVSLWLCLPHRKANGPVGAFCRAVIQSARRYDDSANCAVCDELVRGRPALHIAALRNDCHEDLNGPSEAQLRAWDDMKRAAAASAEPSASPVTCGDVLQCLAVRVAQKAQSLAQPNKSEAEKPRRLSALVAAARGSFPMAVCGAAIAGGANGEAALSCLLRGEDAEAMAILEKENQDDKKRKRRREDERTSEARAGQEMLEEEPRAVRCDAFAIQCTEGKEEANQMGGSSFNGTGPNGLKPIHEDEEKEEEEEEGEVDLAELLDFVPCVPRLREEDGVLECAGCLSFFHQECVCPAQRELAFGHFLCHSCRLHADPPLPLIINTF